MSVEESVTVPNRHADWFRQAEADLKHARHALEDGDFEWSWFAAHQAAQEASQAIAIAEEMLEFCRHQIQP
jgi:HEPN domain-containing protein